MVLKIKYQQGIFKPLQRVNLPEGIVIEVNLPQERKGSKEALKRIEGKVPVRSSIVDAVEKYEEELILEND